MTRRCGAPELAGGGAIPDDQRHVRHLRVPSAPDTPLGPGQVDLLQHRRDAGSIAAAGRDTGMSGKRTLAARGLPQ